MKTLTIKKITQLLGIMMITALFSNPIYAQNKDVASSTVTSQDITIKGKVMDENGPLPGVNIVLKGSKTGAVTDVNGEFTFPKSLSSGDVLIFSFLGYDKQEIKIDGKTTYINLLMSNDIIEIMGAPSTDKPYKSKRSN
ncbi:carboxypeptidase-like regulatory domain-containing protein [Psychroserpens luteus]|uniref:Carboxypeptidase-like regulatory domain-containing protein n=1 Tax=Psychroserpens luteus TaxID=1434066 RepID=A0ABW5ZVE5_9FLAO|nr:carboxypeptidase-like regulatory domain-containing protein [Psychroserpens luteus]